MKIEKIINNNIVVSEDNEGNEIIVMGRGIGFKRKAGMEIPQEMVEKIFKLENEDSMERFKDMVKNLPMEYLKLSAEIIAYAKEQLDVKLSETVYLTLTDHISFTIDQYKKGRTFQNMLLEEVKRFYTDEYMVGMHAISMIQERTGCDLQEDEAASIALHLVNAEFGLKVNDTWKMTNMMWDMMNLIEYELGIQKEDAYYKGWMTVNLKFLAHRMLWLEPERKQPDPTLFEFIRNHYGEEYALTGRIRQFLKEKYECEMTEEENLYLVLNIKRIKDLYLHTEIAERKE